MNNKYLKNTKEKIIQIIEAKQTLIALTDKGNLYTIIMRISRESEFVCAFENKIKLVPIEIEENKLYEQ
jgi:hypothetical protein